MKLPGGVHQANCLSQHEATGHSAPGLQSTVLCVAVPDSDQHQQVMDFHPHPFLTLLCCVVLCYAGLHKSHLFLIILGIIVVCQVMIINFLGVVFHVAPLTWQEWLVTVAIGSGSLFWSFLIRFFSRTVFSSGKGPTSSSGGLGAWITTRLVRFNQVKSKQLLAAAAVYDANKLCGVEMSVQEAVTLAREKAANKAQEEADGEDGKQSRIKAWLGRRGQAGSKEERTLSGRSDSAGSMGRAGK